MPFFHFEKDFIMACVLVTEIMDPSGTSILKDAGHDVVEGWTLSADELGARYPDIDAIMVRTNKIPADMMAQMPNLKIVSKHGVGCDNIDVTYARANNIAVAIAVDANADSVAEHTLMFMLMLAKNPREMDRVVREDYSLRKATKAVDIGARTVLVVGYGRIGTRVARLCATFGMTVLIHDTKFTGAETKIDGYEVVHDIDEALRRTDVLTVHIPLTNQTASLFGHDKLHMMPAGSYVVNCARGGIIDEAAIRDLTQSGHLAGAAFDVFSHEPILPDNPILAAKNTLLSAHTAAFTTEGLERMASQAGQNICDHMNGTLCEDNIYKLEAFSGN